MKVCLWVIVGKWGSVEFVGFDSEDIGERYGEEIGVWGGGLWLN